GAVADQAIDLVEEATMVAKPRQRIGKGQIRVFPAWLTGAKRRLHHVPVLTAVFPARLAAKRLGKVSEKRFFRGPEMAREHGRKTRVPARYIFSRLA
ncbi:hypothetical protein, partial [Mesorhizobium sp.]|uniref:hypothetical protein n=1 Tax=Mesorhizobium sp. TaxID=1871066 RepID=UPI0025FF6FF7